MRIAVVAPASSMSPEVPERVRAVAAALFPEAPPDIAFHPQCFLRHGHFAGDDAARAAALIEVANDPEVDAVWFGRGGYGSCRIAEDVLAGLSPAARGKTFLGYSDCGTLLAGLYGAGCTGAAHGPVAQDAMRDGGERAAARALRWLVARDAGALEPSLRPGVKAAAFNLTILSQLLGTALQPDLDGHVLMLEEVSEHMYRIDRAFCHVTGNPGIRRVAGIRLGRCSAVPPNDPDFGLDEEAVARFWCERSGIPWLGRADIGHDVDNRVVPFG
ncbi:LD-carboxypeptidase [Lichenibacterium dinghuense]|uniref:LD-carboxypeptidase n=1 Tax=Lichenibacterium dinghuense TaxID=2895977 RepID=UPI001F21F299|nr:LD-carboxypeptidase [Lichenibacterium sp. 6Y81]